MESTQTESYMKPLPKEISLEVYNGENLIFQSSGKWLYPLFDLDDFLRTYSGAKDNLRAHDTAIGKAAAVLMTRMNIRRIHANLASELALDYLEGKAEVHFDAKVHRLLCATEDQLLPLTNSDEMYFLLRKRARRVLGVSVLARNVSYKFGNIKNLSFELEPGGRLMVLGGNGSGKTTLLRLISGIYTPVSGEILIDGKIAAQNPKFTIGYVPQGDDMNSVSLSVEEVVSLGVKAPLSERRKIVERSLERTDSLGLYGRNFRELSGGEKQKVQVARCLAQNARLLLLDEPTSALDAKSRSLATEILRSLSLTEIPTIIVVTHDKDLVAELGWPQLELENGNSKSISF